MQQRTIRLNFDLSFVYGPRTWRAPLVAVMLLAAVGDLNSESVTLSTYYPAPSGVYTNMITTGNTFMARDVLPVARGDGSTDSRLGVGLSNPTQKLSVQGNVNLSGRLAVGRPVAVGAVGYLAPAEAVDVLGSVKVNRSGCAPSTTNNGGCGGNYITWAPGVFVEGSWSTGPKVIIEAPTVNKLQGFTMTAPTYYCCPKAP